MESIRVVFLRGSFATTEQVKTTKKKQLTKKNCQTKLKNSCLQNTTFAGCYHLDLLKMVGKNVKINSSIVGLVIHHGKKAKHHLKQIQVHYISLREGGWFR